MPITTDRLVLKRQSLDDFNRFFAMSKDPEVMKYIGDGSIFHWTPEIARDKFKQKLAVANDGPIGTLAVYRQADGHYLGWTAISHSKFLGGMALEYRFCRDAWGRGYATETAAALLEQSDRVMDLSNVMACVHPDNAASIRVLEKLGFACACNKMSKPAARHILVYKPHSSIRNDTGSALK